LKELNVQFNDNKPATFKKPATAVNTEKQKETNRSIPSFRVLLVYAIGGDKKCCIVKGLFRFHKFGFDDLVMELAC